MAAISSASHRRRCASPSTPSAAPSPRGPSPWLSPAVLVTQSKKRSIRAMWKFLAPLAVEKMLSIQKCLSPGVRAKWTIIIADSSFAMTKSACPTTPATRNSWRERRSLISVITDVLWRHPRRRCEVEYPDPPAEALRFRSAVASPPPPRSAAALAASVEMRAVAAAAV